VCRGTKALARDGDGGYATPGVLSSSVRKRLKTRQLQFPAQPRVLKSIKIKGLAYWGGLGLEVGQVNVHVMYYLIH